MYRNTKYEVRIGYIGYSVRIPGLGKGAAWPQGPLLPTWFNFNPSMDK